MGEATDKLKKKIWVVMVGEDFSNLPIYLPVQGYMWTDFLIFCGCCLIL